MRKKRPSNDVHKKPLLSTEVNIQKQDQIINELYKMPANPVSLKIENHFDEIDDNNSNTYLLHNSIDKPSNDLNKDHSTKLPEGDEEVNKEVNNEDLNKGKGIVTNLLSVINPDKAKSNTNPHTVADLLNILTDKHANDSNRKHSIKSPDANADEVKESKHTDLNKGQGIVASLLGILNLEKPKSNEKMPAVVANAISKLTDVDDSIIDITGQSQKINLDPLNSNSANTVLKVPSWNHYYVYSFTEIKAATTEQQSFYYQFKDRFLKGEFVDLEGNNNYAFILLFDLLNDYDIHRNLLLLEKQLEKLGTTYPRTKAYCLTFLVKKLEIAGDREAIIRIRNQQPGTYQYNQSNSQYSYDGNYWGLGTKYQAKLQLKDDEVKILNRLFYSPTNFGSIEYCFIEIVRVFLSTIEQLKEKSIVAGTTLDSIVADVTDVILQKHFKYRKASNNYRYGLDLVSNEIYSNIFKRCENTVREYYDHKRKINTDTYYTTPAAKLEFETKIVAVVNTILPQLVSIIKPPDESTEIELYAQNTNRWKIKFDELTDNFQHADSKLFSENVIALGKLNQKNPSVENIFFEASKFIAKIDKEASLKLYIYYLDYDLKSANFDNKQFTKTIQKSLFQNNDQLHDFEIIISELLADKNLDRALAAVSKLYLPKRKKIKLDNKSILEVQQQHSGTVELLNEYLQDDYESDTSTIKSKEINDDELKIEIVQKTEFVENSNYVVDISFTPVQIETLEVFAKRNFTVEQAELTDFAKQKGAFVSRLVESINEVCYEKLDDILIEEEDEFYSINQEYYKRLLKV